MDNFLKQPTTSLFDHIQSVVPLRSGLNPSNVMGIITNAVDTAATAFEEQATQTGGDFLPPNFFQEGYVGNYSESTGHTDTTPPADHVHAGIASTETWGPMEGGASSNQKVIDALTKYVKAANKANHFISGTQAGGKTEFMVKSMDMILGGAVMMAKQKKMPLGISEIKRAIRIFQEAQNKYYTMNKPKTPAVPVALPKKKPAPAAKKATVAAKKAAPAAKKAATKKAAPAVKKAKATVATKAAPAAKKTTKKTTK